MVPRFQDACRRLPRVGARLSSGRIQVEPVVYDELGLSRLLRLLPGSRRRRRRQLPFQSDAVRSAIQRHVHFLNDTREMRLDTTLVAARSGRDFGRSGRPLSIFAVLLVAATLEVRVRFQAGMMTLVGRLQEELRRLSFLRSRSTRSRPVGPAQGRSCARSVKNAVFKERDDHPFDRKSFGARSRSSDLCCVREPDRGPLRVAERSSIVDSKWIA